MSKFLNHLNSLLGSMSIRKDEAQSMADNYNNLSDYKKAWIDGNYRSYGSIEEIETYLKEGANEDSYSKNKPLTKDEERDLTFMTISNKISSIESSVKTISSILVFFTIIWIISIVVIVSNLN